MDWRTLFCRTIIGDGESWAGGAGGRGDLELLGCDVEGGVVHGYVRATTANVEIY